MPGGHENASESRTRWNAEFPYHRCRNSNSASLIKIKETSGGACGVRGAPRGPPLSYLGHNTVRLWALCTPLSRRSAYAPLSPSNPYTGGIFYLFLLRKNDPGLVISGRNVSATSFMGANIFFHPLLPFFLAV